MNMQPTMLIIKKKNGEKIRCVARWHSSLVYSLDLIASVDFFFFLYLWFGYISMPPNSTDDQLNA